MNKVQVGNFKIGNGEALAMVVGPCVIESEDHTLYCAQQLKGILTHHWMNFIFKSSYDKANRTSISSYRGPGLQEGLRILQKVKEQFQVPVVTDVHTIQEAVAAAEVCDMLQIPAFLCRQTDLLIAAAKTGLPIQVKKGQFLAPEDMEHVVNKLMSTGNEKIILIERGTTFGYHNLVVDFRNLPRMKEFGHPVFVDCTHSLQLPSSKGDRSGGDKRYVPLMAKLAVIAEANGLFIEAHPRPEKAKSDAGSMIEIQQLPRLLTELDQIYTLTSKW